jgi:hypothetical protein
MRQGCLQLVLKRAKPAAARKILTQWLAAPVLMALALSAVAHAESEPVLDAAQLVDPALLSGPGWRVHPEVQVRGYQARFRVHTDWGEFEADGVDLLALRVSEMPALEALNRTGVSQVLLESSAEQLGEPASAVAAIAQNPVTTVAGLPEGVARYFSQRWEKLRGRAYRLGDRGHRLVMQDGSPYDDPEGPMGAAGRAPSGPERNWWQKRGREMGKLARQEIGYPAARAALAERLAVDPHTRHPLIAPRLDALAWAETTGRLASGEALAMIAGPARDVLSQSVEVNDWVLEAAPEQVRQRNHEALAEHCLDERLLRAFINDRAYTPTLQTEFTQLYAQLAPAAGCEALIETALMAEDEVQARFVVNAMKMTSHALGREAHGGRFVPQGALLAYQTPSGEFVLPLAVDWLSWTPEIQGWFDLPTIGGRSKRTLLVSGTISPLAQAELTERGWSQVSGLPYPGAPPYRRALQLAAQP